MDQPYSRIADALLDHQFWAPDDPQKHPYDDTGWSFSHLFNVKVVRVPDAAILKAAMTPLDDPATLTGKLAGSGSLVAVANNGQVSLLSLVYKLKGASIQIAEKPFDADGQPLRRRLTAHLRRCRRHPDRCAPRSRARRGAPRRSALRRPRTPLTAPRIAIMHTWLATQTEGWWRFAFDTEGVPYDYISTQTVAKEADLRSKYDVIVFAPVGRASTQEIIDGLPMWNNALPWEKTDLTPNLGRVDSTADMRPGLGYDGLEHLKQFIAHGGLLITCEDTAQFAIDTGLAPGVSVAPAGTRASSAPCSTPSLSSATIPSPSAMDSTFP